MRKHQLWKVPNYFGRWRKTEEQEKWTGWNVFIFFVKPFSFYLVQLQLPRRVNAWGESLSFTSHLRRAKTLNLARTRSQSSLEKQASSEEGGSLPGFVGGERDCVCISSTQFVLPPCRDKSTLPWQPWAHGHSSAGLLRRGISRERWTCGAYWGEKMWWDFMSNWDVLTGQSRPPCFTPLE